MHTVTSAGIHPDKHAKANEESLENQYTVIVPRGEETMQHPSVFHFETNKITNSFSFYCVASRKLPCTV